MRKFIELVKGFPNHLRNQWKNLFNSKHEKMSEGAAEMYRARPKAHGDNWRRPEHHNNSEKHHNQPPKKSS